jgi:hypothetical protein
MVLSLQPASFSPPRRPIHHHNRAVLEDESLMLGDEEDEAEEALAALAGGGIGEAGGEEVNQDQDDLLLLEDLLEENEDDNEEEKKEAEEEEAKEQQEQEEYAGPVVVEYEHDVAMPSLMTGEQFEAAMEAQFLQPHRVSKQARKALIRKRAREGGDAAAGNDALVLFALLRPHPTRWYVWGGEEDLSMCRA